MKSAPLLASTLLVSTLLACWCRRRARLAPGALAAGALSASYSTGPAARPVE